MSAPAVQALYFGAEQQACFGMLHRATGPAPATHALLICGSIGHEDQAAYRGLRELAQLAARRGCTTLRFDYLGSADSNDTAAGPDCASTNLACVHAAIDTLRAQTDVQRVCVLGLRTGALFAAVAASQRQDVDAFVALMPVSSGRAYVREATLRAAASGDDALALLEFGGFVLSPQARQELIELDLVRLPNAPASSVMLVHADDRPGDARWLRRLADLGADVTSLCVPDLGALLGGTGDNRIPHDALRDVVNWVCARPAAPAHTAHCPAPAAPTSGELHLPGLREVPMPFVVDGATMFGILSVPEHAPPRRVVVLLNTGAARRIGPSRLYVDWARHWVRHGTAVLRLDLPGLGDSDALPGQADGEVYAVSTVPMLAAAVARLRQRWGPLECQLLGICSGAFHAFRAAAAGVDVESVVLINQSAYFWRPNRHMNDATFLTKLCWAVHQRCSLTCLLQLHVALARRLAVVAAA